MHFENPILIALIPLLLLLFIISRRKAKSPAFTYPTSILLENVNPTLRISLLRGIPLLRIIILVLVVIALSRPQSVLEESRIETEGIDIVLAIDTSTSMLAEDFKIDGKRTNRLEAVKNVVRDFINGRNNDRIGIVAFAANAYTVSPLTLDYGWLIQNLDRVKIGMIEDGTAIGSGIISAVNRVKRTRTKSKVIILLTDGRNNAGRISPLTAAEAAAALNVKVYTIGAGTKGLAPYPAKDFFGNTVYQRVKIEIDEETLRQIAQRTNGRYFRATDTESLRKIYSEIDRLEKTKFEEKGYTEYKELFHLFLIPAMLLLMAEILISNTILRRIP